MRLSGENSDEVQTPLSCEGKNSDPKGNGEESQSVAGNSAVPAWSVFPEPTDIDNKASYGIDARVMSTGLIEQRWNEAAKFGETVVLADRFQLDSQVGSGGMGVVFRATDLSSKQPVALKILRSHLMFQASAWTRFQKEARVWQEIQCPNVVRFLGLESDSGQQFMVSEFVEGLSLNKWLDHYGPMPEHEAIRLFSEICQGLKSIHRAGVIHRDLTPGNILLEAEVDRLSSKVTDSSNKLANSASRDSETKSGTSQPRFRTAKISDFGLARHSVQSQSMAVTQSRSMLGTPKYLAPEMYADRPVVDATTDLYSLGISFYQTVIGKAPFEHEDLWKLADQHRFLPPPDPQSIRPELSNGLRLILLRLLEKRPEDRYQTADELLTDLQKLKSGESILNAKQYFQLPANDRLQRTVEFRWELKSEVEELWPMVTQTNRVNRAMGLPAPQFTPLSSTQPALYNTQVKLFGMPLQWVEYPFCWIEGREMSVQREFRSGPYQTVISQVQLYPRPGGGTLLVHQFRFVERNLLGRWFANWQIGSSTRRTLDRIYRRLDEQIQRTKGSIKCADPFCHPVRLGTDFQSCIEKVALSFAKHGIPESIRTRLEDLLTTASEDDLLQIRVRKLARNWSVGESGLLRALLLASQAGALQLAWDVICPKCRATAIRRDQLSRILEHEHCDICQLKFDTEFTKNVELVFEVSPMVRKVARSVWCIGGPFHAPHVVAQVYLRPRQEAVLQLQLAAGEYLLTNRMSSGTTSIHVIEGSAPDDSQSTVAVDTAHNSTSNRALMYQPGRQQIHLSNPTPNTALLRIERVARNRDVLSAAEALAHRSFRDIFPNEIVAPQNLLSLETAFFLAIRWSPVTHSSEPCESTPLSLATLNLIAHRIDPLVRKYFGEIIDLAEEVIIVVFHDQESANDCFTDLRATTIADSASSTEYSLRVKLESGPALVSHLLGHPKYLGRTLQQLVLDK